MKIQLWLFKFQHKAGAFDKKKRFCTRAQHYIYCSEGGEGRMLYTSLYHYTKNVSFAFNVHFIVSVVVHKDFTIKKKKNIPNK